jgi:YHS domain-containing protein
MRGLLLLGLIMVLVVVLWPVVKSALERLGRTRLEESGGRDELVKDPVCGTYVVRSRAIRDESGGRSVYFCGPRCAAEFSERERKT